MNPTEFLLIALTALMGGLIGGFIVAKIRQRQLKKNKRCYKDLPK